MGEGDMKGKRKRSKRRNYARAANEERDFLNAQIARFGFFGSRHAGSHGVGDISFVTPKERLFFTWGKSEVVFFANGFSGLSYRSTLDAAMKDAIDNCRNSFTFQLKDSEATARRAARDWASGKTQRDWRERWECKHKKLMEKMIE